MIDILRTVHIEKTRKPHKCFGCSRIINPPARMTLVATAQDGTAYTDYFCSTCQIIRGNSYPWDEFSEGQLRDAALKLEEEAYQLLKKSLLSLESQNVN